MNSTVETSSLSVSIMELSKEDLQSEFNNLKKEWTSNKTELELKNQQLYDLKRELQRAVAIEKECMQELEILQFDGNVVVKRNHALEEEVTSLKESRRVGILDLQEELNAKENKIINLETELKNVKETTISVNTDEYDKLADANFNLKHELELSISNFEELTNALECMKKLNITLEGNFANIQSEYDSLREIYNCKKEELIEANNLIETLQEDLLITKNELDMLRTKPMDPLSRGNSLFAEVDDRRLELQGNMRTMKTQYVEMRRDRSSLLYKVTALQNENTMLSKRWEDDNKCKEVLSDRLLESNHQRIKYLEEIVKKYEELQLERHKITGSHFKPEHLQFLETKMNNKDSEIKRLLKDVNRLSTSETILLEEVCGANTMLREWKTKATRLQCEIAQLKTQVELNKVNGVEELGVKPPVKCMDCQKQKSKKVGVPKASMKVLENSKLKVDTEAKKIQIIDEPKLDITEFPLLEKRLPKLNEKENTYTNTIIARKVKFAEDTAEPKITDRKMYRPKGKLVVYSPAIPPTIPTIRKKES